MDTELKSRDWARLSDLILDLILQKMPSLSDYLRFSVVCKSWFSFASNNYDALQQRINSTSVGQLPLLLIFRGGDNLISMTADTSLYSVTKDKILLDFKLPLYRCQICCGSSHGWLAYQCNFQNYIGLFNPFSGERINLPCLIYRAFKVILSKNPSTNPNSFEVVAMCYQWPTDYLIFAILKPGSQTWNFIYRKDTDERFCDMINQGGKYYTVNNKGVVSSIDKTTLEYNNLVRPVYPNTNSFYSGEFYLVKTTTDELLRVEIRHEPLRIKISKLVTSPMTQKSRFVVVDNLGEEALFLCECDSMSVLASKYLGCKSNSIYYIDRYNASSCDYYLNIIDLQDGSVRTLISFNEPPIGCGSTIPPASFIIPTPMFTT